MKNVFFYQLEKKKSPKWDFSSALLEVKEPSITKEVENLFQLLHYLKDKENSVNFG